MKIIFCTYVINFSTHRIFSDMGLPKAIFNDKTKNIPINVLLILIY